MTDQLKAEIVEAVGRKIAGTDIFLVEVKISPSKVVVLIDKPAGITITECIDLTRFLHETFEASGVFEKHELEVSSPGMEEPLKVLQQYHRRIGKEVRVLMTNGIVKNGILKAANDEGVEVEERVERKVDKKKTVQVNSLQIPFKEIKETTVIFSFLK